MDKEIMVKEIMRLSGVLIPISLAIIIFLIQNTSSINNTVLNILRFTIPLQILLLVLSILFGILVFESSKQKDKHLWDCKWCFITGLVVMAINYAIIFFSI